MDKKIIIIIFFSLLALALILFPKTFSIDKIESNYFKENTESGKNNSPEEDYPKEMNKTPEGNISSGDGGSGGGGGGSSEDLIDETEPEKLPEDVNTSECGFYSGEYGVCAGTCPEGECVSDGEESCFCQKT